jgi:hypothetical protein
MTAAGPRDVKGLRLSGGRTGLARELLKGGAREFELRA